MKTVIGIQDRYIERVNEAWARWSHRPTHGRWDAPGQAGRTRAAASREARRELLKLGFTEAQASDMIRQAADVAELQRNAEES